MDEDVKPKRELLDLSTLAPGELERWREWAMRSASEHDKTRDSAFVLHKNDALVYFWEGQTDEEVALMKQWLADKGFATWMNPPRRSRAELTAKLTA